MTGEENSGKTIMWNKNDLILFDPSEGITPIFSYMGIYLPKDRFDIKQPFSDAKAMDSYKESKNFEFELIFSWLDKKRFRGNMVAVSSPAEKEILIEKFGWIGYIVLSQEEYERYKDGTVWCKSVSNATLCWEKKTDSAYIVYGLDITNNFEGNPSIETFIHIIKPSQEIIFLKDPDYLPDNAQKTITSIRENDASGCESRECIVKTSQEVETMLKKELTTPSPETQSRFVEIENIVNMLVIK